MTSAIFTHAAQEWARMRHDYERYIEQAYNLALQDTGGVLVNKAGRARKIDGLDLFTGPQWRANKYASEELIDYWRLYPRMSLAEFELQWLQGNERYAYATG
jgi:hypothetical protein